MKAADLVNRPHLLALAIVISASLPWSALAQADSILKAHAEAPAARHAEEAGPDGLTTSALAATLGQLQQAVAANDAAGVAALTSFPLQVNFASGRKQKLSRQQFSARFAEIFTPKVREAVAGQQPDALFRNAQGAMIGDGQVWCRASVSMPRAPARRSGSSRSTCLDGLGRAE